MLLAAPVDTRPRTFLISFCTVQLRLVVPLILWRLSISLRPLVQTLGSCPASGAPWSSAVPPSLGRGRVANNNNNMIFFLLEINILPKFSNFFPEPQKFHVGDLRSHTRGLKCSIKIFVIDFYIKNFPQLFFDNAFSTAVMNHFMLFYGALFIW